MSTKLTTAIEAAILLTRQQPNGVLSTISSSISGYPFGSIVPFVVNPQGDVLIYASDIAQHTRNIKADSRVSLFIHDPTQQESQANARVTIVGDATADIAAEADIQRYLRLFPQAQAYQKTHDFRFYLIKTKRIRFIGGFGDIHWLPEDLWRASFVDLTTVEMAAITHMHDDHADALAAIATYWQKSQPEGVVDMLSIFHNGCHLKTSSGIVFVPFIAPITHPSGMRQAIINIAKHARTHTADRD